MTAPDDIPSPALIVLVGPAGSGKTTWARRRYAGNEIVSADALRAVILDAFDMSLGTGLSKVAKKVFRIGHLGDTNDLTIVGALAGVEMGLGLAGVPHQAGGVATAMAYLAGTKKGAAKAA